MYGMSGIHKLDPWHPNYRGFSSNPITTMRPATAVARIRHETAETKMAPAVNPLTRSYSSDHQTMMMPYKKALDVVVPSYRQRPLTGRVAYSSTINRDHHSFVPPNIASYSKYSPSDWTRHNLRHYALAESTRNMSEKLRSDAMNVLRETHEITCQSQKEVGKRLGERISDISFWSYELDNELDKLIVETNNLSEVKRQLEKALADTEQPTRVAQECLYFREKRQSMDLVHDKVEENVLKEVEVIKNCQEKMRLLLDRIQVQLRSNRAAQHKLEQDYHHKQDAFHIDTKCHILTDTSQCLAHHQGVENIDNAITLPNTWAEFTNRNVQQSQLERTASTRLRAETDSLMATCSSDIWLAYNNTNVSISNRISDSLDAQRGLQAHLSKVSQEIYEMERNIEFLRRAIQAKTSPLKLAQTRLESRLHRPDVELCHDAPHIRLVHEVRELQESIDKLEINLQEADVTLQQLVRVRSQLEQELKVKANSIFIDREQCQGIRKSFPYRIAYSL